MKAVQFLQPYRLVITFTTRGHFKTILFKLDGTNRRLSASGQFSISRSPVTTDTTNTLRTQRCELRVFFVPVVTLITQNRIAIYPKNNPLLISQRRYKAYSSGFPLIILQLGQYPVIPPVHLPSIINTIYSTITSN